MQPIGAALAVAVPLPPPPVRAGSRPMGTAEAELWGPTPPAWVDTITAGARELAREGWRQRRAGGDAPRLGRLALAVLGELGRLVDWRTGRLEPSYDELAARVGASRSGVALALVELREAGLVTWARRYVPTGQEEGPGPRVRQVSNAYALRLPPAAERALARAGEVAAGLAARARALRMAEREAREARWAEARARRELARAELAEARERAATRGPTPPSPAPRQSDRDAFNAALATARRLLGDPPERESNG